MRSQRLYPAHRLERRSFSRRRSPLSRRAGGSNAGRRAKIDPRSQQADSQALLAQLSRELAASLETTLAIDEQGDLTELLQAIVRRAADLVHAHMGGLYLMRPDRQSLELVVAHNLPGNLAGTVLQLGEGLSGRVALTGEVLAVDDYMAWEGRAAVYGGMPFRRVLGVPLKVRGAVIGVIDVTDDRLVGPFDPDEVCLVRLFADQAAIAVQSSRLLAEARRRNASLAGLYELAVAITGVQDRATVLRRLYEQVAPLFNFDGLMVALCQDPLGSEYQLALAVEKGEDVPALQARRVPLSEGGLTGHVLQTRQLLLVADLEKEPLPVVPQHVGQPARAWLGVPLMAQGRLLGAVTLQSFQPNAFDQEDLKLLEAMARQVSVALENSRLFGEAQRRDVILAALAEISELLLAPADLPEVLPEALAQLGLAACVSRCYIFENHRAPDGAALMSQRYEWVMPGASPQIENPQLQNIPYLTSGFGRWAEVLSAGQPLYGLVADFPPAERPLLESQDIRSIAVVPIFSDGAWWGFLGFDDCVGERIWSVAEIEALKSAAAVLGAAFARQRAEMAERQQRLLAETLRDTALALTSTLSFEELLDRVLANAQRLVPSDAASIFLVEGEVARVVRTRGYAERGLEEMALSMAFRIADNHNLAAMVATRQPCVIRDVWAVHGWLDLPTSRWMGSYLGAPIVVDGEVIGFLNLDFAEREAVPADGPRLLQAFAAQAGAALANARLYQALETQAARARQLALDLMHAQEAERQAVARELHDEMGQALTALLLNLGALERSLAGAADARSLERLAEARWLAEETLGRTRALSLDLRPPALDDLGLVPAVRWHLDQFGRRSDLAVSFHVSGEEQPIPPATALALYRILQEATTNVSRHAHARRLEVTLDCGADAVRLQIKDDGQGFDLAALEATGSLHRSSGLLGMRERAAALGGECVISAQPGHGTRVQVRIPVVETTRTVAHKSNG